MRVAVLAWLLPRECPAWGGAGSSGSLTLAPRQGTRCSLLRSSVGGEDASWVCRGTRAESSWQTSWPSTQGRF